MQYAHNAHTLLLTLVVLVFFSVPGLAQVETQGSITKIENYFEKLQTMRANFVQMNQDGTIYKGKFYLLRPNKFRLDYTDPSTLLVLSDGNSVINYDSDIGDPGYISIDSTPAYFILQRHVKLSGDITVSSLLPGENTLRATLVKTKDSQMGSLTLIFTNQPFQLKAWIVLDSQGTKTQTVLSDIQENIALDHRLFRFYKMRH
ncbi:MAG: outer membrane lipoprotein carrier protein LolA [Pseudomonadota bacterium]